MLRALIAICLTFLAAVAGSQRYELPVCRGCSIDLATETHTGPAAFCPSIALAFLSASWLLLVPSLLLRLDGSFFLPFVRWILRALDPRALLAIAPPVALLRERECALLLERSLQHQRQPLLVIGEDTELASSARDADVPALMSDQMRLLRIDVEEDAVSGPALRSVDGARVSVLPMELAMRATVWIFLLSRTSAVRASGSIATT